jgi:hypothetical protein
LYGKIFEKICYCVRKSIVCKKNNFLCAKKIFCVFWKHRVKVSASCVQKIFLCEKDTLLCIIISLIFSYYNFYNKIWSWSWILQNIMAFSLASNALSYYRLSTFKTITILLTIFFIYDIFMVFVTPLFTNVLVWKGSFIHTVNPC